MLLPFSGPGLGVLLAKFVKKAGDTMTGLLTISPATGDGLVVNGTTTDNTSGNIKANNGFVYARGVFDENTTTAGIYMGFGPSNDTPRFLLSVGNATNNFQIDNDFGIMRFFLPGNTIFEFDSSSLTAHYIVNLQGGLSFSDGQNIALGTTTGTKIGTAGGASGQKLGFFNKTPITQPLLATGAGHTVDDVITVLQNLGLVRQA